MAGERDVEPTAVMVEAGVRELFSYDAEDLRFSAEAAVRSIYMVMRCAGASSRPSPNPMMSARTADIFVDCVYFKSHRAGADFVDHLFGNPPAFRSESVKHGAECAERAGGGSLPDPDAAAQVDKGLVQVAIRTLTEARRIRADADLMARIRYHIRDQRDELAGLLDELGV